MRHWSARFALRKIRRGFSMIKGSSESTHWNDPMGI